jgi:hypothetical protein
MFTYLWNNIYENLVVKSVCLNPFSLLGSSSSSSVDTSSFGCVVILSPYLTMNFVISSLIVGTFKSVCKTLLDINHGAFTIARRTLFWYLCNISMFELLAVPQRISDHYSAKYILFILGTNTIILYTVLRSWMWYKFDRNSLEALSTYWNKV